MSSEPHLQVLNGSLQASHPADATFTIFSDLPIEIRLSIWRMSMMRVRIIEISVRSLPKVAAPFKHRVLTTFGKQQNRQAEEERFISELASAYSVEDWGPGSNPESVEQRTRKGVLSGAVVQGQKVLSKLLYVNKEARKEAQTFYRIHIPCKFVKEGLDHRGEETIALDDVLLFNPEYDFLYIRPENRPYKMTLSPFWVYIKTSLDPCHVGILNLALNHQDLSQAVPGQIPEPWEFWTPNAREDIVGISESTQEVF